MPTFLRVQNESLSVQGARLIKVCITIGDFVAGWIFIRITCIQNRSLGRDDKLLRHTVCTRFCSGQPPNKCQLFHPHQQCQE